LANVQRATPAEKEDTERVFTETDTETETEKERVCVRVCSFILSLFH